MPTPRFCVLPLAASAVRLQFCIIGGTCHKYHFFRDKSFIATNTYLSRQKYACRDKIMFVAVGGVGDGDGGVDVGSVCNQQTVEKLGTGRSFVRASLQ